MELVPFDPGYTYISDQNIQLCLSWKKIHTESEYQVGRAMNNQDSRGETYNIYLDTCIPDMYQCICGIPEWRRWCEQ